MAIALELFEQVVRRTPAPEIADEVIGGGASAHPFELRNVHSGFPPKVRKLFDNGHGAEATFLAFKYVEKVVQKHANVAEIGEKLMMTVFNPDGPVLKLNGLASLSEKDEQRGYRFVFAGAVVAIRNPGGHEVELSDDPDVCLDHLTFASLLLRRLERSGYK
ncbi:TIGR02391 family protein [Paucibacter sp. R3-3]|uniref:TIGR02391 family protein n=1 Tax=Roseateles agri TaxID=3098619 RepID=A0ABU5DCG5_9BURK|nr:TIGR02391 family protein [Paucibacter sp. R3-3]MDY0743388.1 TIGR02391 family protein [Paucibacter sp. R3-3]